MVIRTGLRKALQNTTKIHRKLADTHKTSPTIAGVFCQRLAAACVAKECRQRRPAASLMRTTKANKLSNSIMGNSVGLFVCFGAVCCLLYAATWAMGFGWCSGFSFLDFDQVELRTSRYDSVLAGGEGVGYAPGRRARLAADRLCSHFLGGGSTRTEVTCSHGRRKHTYTKLGANLPETRC